MRADNVLCVDAMELLIRGLGEIDAERFIYLIKSEHFDYTEWQRMLWEEKNIEEIHEEAKAFSMDKRANDRK
ncbi:MAG: hypothetical protein LBQ66_15810 [Planctomycetaceae bacterium]|jgi:hypothetical protein|nr:hypothetical protein [Planctomycetaceae bacterium]